MGVETYHNSFAAYSQLITTIKTPSSFIIPIRNNTYPTQSSSQHIIYNASGRRGFSFRCHYTRQLISFSGILQVAALRLLRDGAVGHVCGGDIGGGIGGGVAAAAARHDLCDEEADAVQQGLTRRSLLSSS